MRPFARFYCIIDVLLLLISVGLLIFGIVGLLQFADETQGIVAGILTFSVAIQFLTLFAITLALRAFFIESTMWLVVAQSTLCVVMTFTIIGAVFFSVLSGSLVSDNGFQGIVTDIEDNFNKQVFEDCCIETFDVVGVDPADFLQEGFSFGDIVPDALCLTLIDNSRDTFVGDGDDDCGGANFEFQQFEDDFSGFTEGLFFTLEIILWIQAALLLLTFLLNCLLMTFASPQYEGQYEVDEQGNYIAPPYPNQPPTNQQQVGEFGTAGATDQQLPPPSRPYHAPKPLLPPSVKMFMNRLSARVAPKDSAIRNFTNRMSANMPRLQQQNPSANVFARVESSADPGSPSPPSGGFARPAFIQNGIQMSTNFFRRMSANIKRPNLSFLGGRRSSNNVEESMGMPMGSGQGTKPLFNPPSASIAPTTTRTNSSPLLSYGSRDRGPGPAPIPPKFVSNDNRTFRDDEDW